MTDQKDPKKPKKIITPDQMAKMTPGQRASYMNRLRAENFKPDASEANTSQTARATADTSQKTKIDPLNPSKNTTPPQVSRWLNLGLNFHARNKAAEQAAREAKAQAQAEATASIQAKAEKIAVLHTSSAEKSKVTFGKVAQYALNPFDYGQSFRGFKYAAAMLVQIFARILTSVGLIAPDHPARTPSGALGYGLFRLLEEARLNLLPLKVFQEKSTAGPFAEIRIIAVRQYIVFTAIIGLFATGFVAILMEISQVVFGAAYAFAQGAQSTVTTGISMGGCPLITSGGNASAIPDYASACLDGIFGTGANSTASVVGSGFGLMLSMYSNLILVFAGIIVIWIIISAVAETARSGIPLGKNFNHIWAPIRLVVALGLLVPLPSGLNSGQYVVISLAKWGSQQASTIWNAYAAKITSNSGLPSVSYDVTQNASFVAQNLQIAVCNAIQNASGCTGDGTGCQIAQTSYNPSSFPASSIIGQNTPTLTQTPDPSTINIGWYVPDGGTPTPSPQAGYPICGALSIKAKSANSSIASNATNCTQTPNTPACLAQTAEQSILTAQNATDISLVGSLQTAARDVQAVAQEMIASNANEPSSSAVSQIYNDYQNTLSAYQNSQTLTIQAAINNYSSKLAASTQIAQQGGWLYAPVWLMNIVNANAAVSDATKNIAAASGPVQLGNGIIFPGSNDAGNSPQNQWTMAQVIFNAAIPANITTPSPQTQYSTKILTSLSQLTDTTSKNPLALAGVYGRDMIVTGFFLIEPKNVQDCYIAGAIKSPLCDKLAANTAAGISVLPGMSSGSNNLISKSNADPEMHGMLFPIGMVMISMGFLLTMLTFIPLSRFILGVLNWMIGVFEAVLAVPLVALSLLATGGEGFSTQQFTADIWLLVGVVLRPVLMAIGMVASITLFNDIMQITNVLFAPAVQTMPLTSDNSYLSLGIYVVVYSSLAYTLANSAFKLIDMMPNWIMNWIGARMESRVDDASAIQQQSSGYIQTMAYARDSSQFSAMQGGRASPTGGGTPGAGKTTTGGGVTPPPGGKAPTS